MSSSVQPSVPDGGPDPAPVGSVDPAAKPVRRSFTAEYRARVVSAKIREFGGKRQRLDVRRPVGIADPAQSGAHRPAGPVRVSVDARHVVRMDRQVGAGVFTDEGQVLRSDRFPACQAYVRHPVGTGAPCRA